ncbi:MAG: hypothetical protein K1X83_01050 [Oligoflexia bacterium]|nr:hypothetical protein [Oligoflexia bacterium]
MQTRCEQREEIRERLRAGSFDGPGGVVRFDRNNDVIDSPYYLLPVINRG